MCGGGGGGGEEGSEIERKSERARAALLFTSGDKEGD